MPPSGSGHPCPLGCPAPPDTAVKSSLAPLVPMRRPTIASPDRQTDHTFGTGLATTSDAARGIHAVVQRRASMPAAKTAKSRHRTTRTENLRYPNPKRPLPDRLPAPEPSEAPTRPARAFGRPWSFSP